MARFKLTTHHPSADTAADLIAKGIASTVAYCKEHNDWLVVCNVETLAAMAQLLYDLAHPGSPVGNVSPGAAVAWLEREREPRVSAPRTPIPVRPDAVRRPNQPGDTVVAPVIPAQRGHSSMVRPIRDNPQA